MLLLEQLIEILFRHRNVVLLVLLDKSCRSLSKREGSSASETGAGLDISVIGQKKVYTSHAAAQLAQGWAGETMSRSTRILMQECHTQDSKGAEL